MKLGLGLFNSHQVSLPSYTVAVSADPVGGGALTGAGTYKKGTTVIVEATPSETYNFVSWKEDGSVVSTDATYEFPLEADRTLVAEFALIEYTIGVSASPAPGGSPTGGGTYTKNDTVTVHANPGATYNFVNWTEGGTPVSTDADYSFTATANRTLVANYALIQYTISISVDPVGGGSTTGAGTYTKNDPVSVDADFAAGYGFVAWKENGSVVSLDPTYNLTATSNRSLVAEFEVVPPVGTHWGYALDLDGSSEYASAPHLFGLQLASNNSFVDWTAGVPNSWTKQGTSDGSNYIEESPVDSLHIVSNGSTMGVSQNILTMGKRYYVKIDVTVNSGSMKLQLGGSGSAKVISTSGLKEFDLYCDGTDGILFVVRNAACNVVVNSIEVYEYVACLDIVAVANKITNFNNSGMEQATSFAWATGGNHTSARSSSNPKWGAYTLRATVTGTGDATTNNVSLPSASITALVSGEQYAFSLWAYSDTANRTLNWQIGDKSGSKILTSATTWYKIEAVFTAGASTVNQPIKIWFTGGSCSVYMDSIKLQKKQDFALSVWFKADSTADGGLFSLCDTNSPTAIELYLSGNALWGDIYDFYNQGEVTHAFTDTTKWHLVTLTYTGTTLSLYIDGVLENTQVNVHVGDMAWYGNIMLGYTALNSHYFDGLLGEVQFVRFDDLSSSDFDATDYFLAGLPKSYVGGAPTIDLHFKWEGASDLLMLANAGTLGVTLTGTNVTQAADQVLTDKADYITRD